MSVSLSGALPDGDGNGLGHMLAQLVDQPNQVHVAVILFDVSKLVTKTDTGDVTPVVRIRAVEPVIEQDVDHALRLHRRAHADRTGQQQLPLELESAIDSWLTAAAEHVAPDDDEGDPDA